MCKLKGHKIKGSNKVYKYNTPAFLPFSAHESSANADKSRAMLAKQVSDLQLQLEDAEANSGKGLKNQIRKMEQRVSVSLV